MRPLIVPTDGTAALRAESGMDERTWSCLWAVITADLRGKRWSILADGRQRHGRLFDDTVDDYVTERLAEQFWGNGKGQKWILGNEPDYPDRAKIRNFSKALIEHASERLAYQNYNPVTGDRHWPGTDKTKKASAEKRERSIFDPDSPERVGPKKARGLKGAALKQTKTVAQTNTSACAAASANKREPREESAQKPTKFAASTDFGFPPAQKTHKPGPRRQSKRVVIDSTPSPTPKKAEESNRPLIWNPSNRVETASAVLYGHSPLEIHPRPALQTPPTTSPAKTEGRNVKVLSSSQIQPPFVHPDRFKNLYHGSSVPSTAVMDLSAWEFQKLREPENIPITTMFPATGWSQTEEGGKLARDLETRKQQPASPRHRASNSIPAEIAASARETGKKNSAALKRDIDAVLETLPAVAVGEVRNSHSNMDSRCRVNERSSNGAEAVPPRNTIPAPNQHFGTGGEPSRFEVSIPAVPPTAIQNLASISRSEPGLMPSQSSDARLQRAHHASQEHGDHASSNATMARELHRTEGGQGPKESLTSETGAYGGGVENPTVHMVATSNNRPQFGEYGLREHASQSPPPLQGSGITPIAPPNGQAPVQLMNAVGLQGFIKNSDMSNTTIKMVIPLKEALTPTHSDRPEHEQDPADSINNGNAASKHRPEAMKQKQSHAVCQDTTGKAVVHEFGDIQPRRSATHPEGDFNTSGVGPPRHPPLAVWTESGIPVLMSLNHGPAVAQDQILPPQSTWQIEQIAVGSSKTTLPSLASHQDENIRPAIPSAIIVTPRADIKAGKIPETGHDPAGSTGPLAASNPSVAGSHCLHTSKVKPLSAAGGSDFAPPQHLTNSNGTTRPTLTLQAAISSSATRHFDRFLHVAADTRFDQFLTYLMTKFQFTAGEMDDIHSLSMQLEDSMLVLAMDDPDRAWDWEAWMQAFGQNGGLVLLSVQMDEEAGDR